MDVAELVGRTLARCGVDRVFGVVGSGNFDVTNAMVAAGSTFVAARHEGGAATMADAYARMSGTVAALSVHQGCGLTNALTGIGEAAKSRTPMVVLAPEATSRTSNFYVDQDAAADAVSAVPLRISDAAEAERVTVEAVRLARDERRVVVLNLPLDVQATQVSEPVGVPLAEPPRPQAPSAADVLRLAEVLGRSKRPVLVAGRGARSPEAREALETLAEAVGALLATSAVAKGLFTGHPWSLDVSGGFSTPAAAELISGADLVVGFGCALNMWTMRHGRLIGEGASVVQVDLEEEALGRHRDLAFGVVGDVAQTANAATALLAEATRTGYRTPKVHDALTRGRRWRDVAYDDWGTDDRIDPRTLTRALDDLLPAERVVGVDSGNFMGYPSMYLEIPDENAFCFTQAFQSIGLGLATTIGAALARPDRIPVAALGDGGALMGISELETVVRLGLPMVVIVYNDAAYGAEVHHFGPSGKSLDTVRFPDTDIAAIGAGFGFQAHTIRREQDLTVVRDWLDGPRDRPLLLDAKVVSEEPSWWLAEAFGH